MDILLSLSSRVVALCCSLICVVFLHMSFQGSLRPEHLVAASLLTSEVGRGGSGVGINAGSGEFGGNPRYCLNAGRKPSGFWLSKVQVLKVRPGRPADVTGLIKEEVRPDLVNQFLGGSEFQRHVCGSGLICSETAPIEDAVLVEHAVQVVDVSPAPPEQVPVQTSNLVAWTVKSSFDVCKVRVLPLL